MIIQAGQDDALVPGNLTLSLLSFEVAKIRGLRVITTVSSKEILNHHISYFNIFQPPQFRPELKAHRRRLLLRRLQASLIDLHSGPSGDALLVEKERCAAMTCLHHEGQMKSSSVTIPILPLKCLSLQLQQFRSNAFTVY